MYTCFLLLFSSFFVCVIVVSLSLIVVASIDDFCTFALLI